MLPLRTPSGDDDDDSDDEGRIRATRERLRERRKHRNRTRHHAQPHIPHSRSQDQGESEALLPSRPRAKSAASMTPLRPPPVPEGSLAGKRGNGGAGSERKRGKSAAGVVERKRGNGGSARGAAAAAAERKAIGLANDSGSVLVTPMPSVSRWLFSFAAVPWLLLAVVFLVEVLEYSRFSNETAGFLEAAEAALTALGAGDAQGGGGGSGRGTAAAMLSGTTVVLKEELARGLVRIYSRHRFLWPFSSFF